MRNTSSVVLFVVVGVSIASSALAQSTSPRSPTTSIFDIPIPDTILRPPPIWRSQQGQPASTTTSLPGKIAKIAVAGAVLGAGVYLWQDSKGAYRVTESVPGGTIGGNVDFRTGIVSPRIPLPDIPTDVGCIRGAVPRDKDNRCRELKRSIPGMVLMIGGGFALPAAIF